MLLRARNFVFLGLIFATVLAAAGCGPQPVRTAPGAPTSSAPQVLASDTRLVEQGQFYILRFELTHPSTVTISVTLKSGPAIDSYIVDEQGLNAWQAMAQNNQSMSFQYFPELSMAPLAGDYTRTAQLAAGRYAFIVDNSKLGVAAPPFHFFKQSPALVAYTLSLSP